jgi:hypothetical protein
VAFATVLYKSSDLLLGDWVARSDEEHVDLEELLLLLEREDLNENVDEDDVELDIESQLLGYL